MTDNSNLRELRFSIENYRRSLISINNTDSVFIAKPRIDWQQPYIYCLSDGTVQMEELIIGHHDSSEPFMLELDYDPKSNQSKAFLFATQGTTEDNSSCSPSMILHQTAALALAISLKEKSIFEHNIGNYQADLALIEEVNDQKVLIDITGHNTKNKLDKMPRGYINISINKYSILSCEAPITEIYSLSEESDSFSTDFIYWRVKEQADSLNCKMHYTQATLDFFMKGYDQHGRSIESHEKAAKIAYGAVIDEIPEVQTKEFNLNEEIRKMTDDYRKVNDFHLRINKDSNFVDALMESDFFCLPKPIIPFQNYSDYETNDKIQIVNNIIDLETDDSVKTHYYVEISNMIMHSKSCKDINSYSQSKLPHDHNLLRHMTSLLNEMERVKISAKVINSFKDRIALHTRLASKDDVLVLPNPIITDQDKFVPSFITISETMKTSSLLYSNNFRMQMDPSHHQYCLMNSVPTTIMNMIERSRDYHELRFKSRISNAIFASHRSGTMFSVSHWLFPNVTAQVYISGLVLASDKGCAYVSYLVDNALYRTEKWQIADIENYSVAYHRLFALSVNAPIVDKETSANMVLIYGRILAENSWGVSKFLKPLRYLATGVCMNSDLIPKQIKKVIETLDTPVCKKFSVYMIMNTLRQKSGNSELLDSRTPLFGFSFEHIGWEAFLVNLCPSKIVGRNKHYDDISKDLLAELKVYNDNIDEISSIYEDFETILSDNDSTLEDRYYEHFKRIDMLSKNTGSRFTASPVSVILINEEIMKLKVNPSSIQNTLNPISDVMTSKGSYDTFSARTGMAINTIESLCIKYGSHNLIELIHKIISKKGIIDLCMILFPKDQPGGNREISQLSNEFRVLQYLCEKFMVNIAKGLDNDVLHDKKKMDYLASRTEQALVKADKLLVTMDQTKWGPNSATAIFGLMNLRLMSKTSEAYMPAMICLLSEFKIFEHIPWLYNYQDLVDGFLSLPGMLARSHMGQGIFHQTSSVYHSLVIKTISSLIKEAAFQGTPYGCSEVISLVVDSLVTSDDVAIFLSNDINDIKSFKANLKNRLVEGHYDDYIECYDLVTSRSLSLLRKIASMLIYFGIKTSDYKNIFSKVAIEFNSIYLSKDSIGSTSMKFIYSLIDPCTTGSIYDDHKNVIQSYYSSIESGCLSSEARSICYMNYFKFIRQWKLNLSDVGLPTIDIIERGIIPRFIVDRLLAVPPNILWTPSFLKYKTRDALNPVSLPRDLYVEMLINTSRLAISHSRKVQNYRSCVTYCKENKLTLMNQVVMSKGLLGMTYRFMIKMLNKDPGFIKDYTDSSIELELEPHIQMVKYQGKLFESQMIRQNATADLDVLSIALSYSKRIDFISSSSSFEEVQLHLFRSRNVSDVYEDVFNVRNMNFLERLTVIKTEIDKNNIDFGSCVRMIFNSERSKDLMYERKVLVNPFQQHAAIYRINILYDVSADYRIMFKMMKSTLTSYIGYMKHSSRAIIVNEGAGETSYQSTSISEYIYTQPDVDVMDNYFLSDHEDVESAYFKTDYVYLNLRMKESMTHVEALKEIVIEQVDVSDEYASSYLQNQLGDITLDIDDLADSDEENDEGMQNFSCLDEVEIFKYISLRIDRRYTCLMSNDIYRRILSSVYLKDLIQNKVVFTNQDSNVSYLQIDNTCRWVCFDKDLGNKINKLVVHHNQTLRSAANVNKDSMFKKAIQCILNNRDDMPIGTAFLRSSFWDVSKDPHGLVVNVDEMKNALVNVYNIIV